MKTKFLHSCVLKLATLARFATFALLLVSPATRADDYYWINSGGGDWGDTNNWSPPRTTLPGSSDNVYITAGGSYTVSITTGSTAANLTLGVADGDSTPTLYCNAAGLEINTNAYAAPGTRIVLAGGSGASLFSGGNLNIVSGSLTLDGEIDWHDGVVGGVIAVTTNGVISSSSSLNHYWTGTIYNQGHILWGADNLIGNSTWLYNLPGGTLDWQNDTLFSGFCCGPLALINAGTMLKSGGTNHLIITPAFSNSGLVLVQSGTLELDSGMTASGTFQISTNAALWFRSGTFDLEPGYASSGAGFYGVPSSGEITLSGTGSDPNFQMNGGLYGTITIAGTLNSYDGYFAGATTIASNAVWNISGCTACGAVGYSTRVAGSVTNAGTINWLSGDWTSEGGTLVNLPGALMTIQCDNTVGSWSGLDNWLNQGVLRKTASTGTNILDGVSFNNAGLVDVQSGGLSFQNGFTSSGIFSVVSGAGLPLAVGAYLLNPGHAFTGAGFYGVPSGGQITLYGTIADPNFQMNGALYGTNLLAGTLNSYDGYFAGATTIASNGVWNISGCTACGADWYSTRVAGSVTNAGTIHWLSGDWVGEGGTLANLPCAVITIQCDNAFEPWSGYDNWFNWGIIRKTAGTSTNLLSGLALNNAGLVDVQSGGLSFQNGFASSGTFNVAAGAATVLAAGTFNLNPGHNFTGSGYYGIPSSSVTINGEIPGDNFQMNGNLYGANTIAGTMNSYDGYFAGATTIASNAVWNISGCTACGSVAYSTRVAGTITNAGTINWVSGDWVSEGGTLANLPGGLITIQCDNAVGNWAGLDNWRNWGTIRKTAGTGVNYLSGLGLTNAGLLDVQSGMLSFQTPYQQMGGQLNFGIAGPQDYGRLEFASAAPLTGTLSANLIGGYQPAPGLNFEVMDYPSASGVFDRTNLPALANNNFWSVLTGANKLTLAVNAPPPLLSISLAGGNLTVAWPASADPGFGLLYATNLTPPILWLPVTNIAQAVGDQKVVNLPRADDQTFFELQK